MEEQQVRHSFRIADLITRYTNDSLNQAQQEELQQWINADVANARLFQNLTGEEGRERYLSGLKNFPSADALTKVKRRLHTKPVMKVQRSKRQWLYASAAAVLLLISAGTWFRVLQKDKEDQLLYATANISPGRNMATLTLANGKKITLDSIAEGRFAEQNGISISKTANGNIVYQVKDRHTGSKSEEFNTIQTPKGGTYQVNLPDGTKVWLNAASSLKFPVSFSGKERRVELAGEGYFEVAKDKTKPFFVKTDSQETEVLGTHFNINAYGDNASQQTTLLEGSVKVSGIKNTSVRPVVLKPGESSLLNSAGIAVEAANIEEDIAWKNGNFRFDNMPLCSILKQLNRWYNIDIDYTDVPELGFTGYISRNEQLYRVLHMLELTGNVKFKMENHILKTMIKK